MAILTHSLYTPIVRSRLWRRVLPAIFALTHLLLILISTLLDMDSLMNLELPAIIPLYVLGSAFPNVFGELIYVLGFNGPLSFRDSLSLPAAFFATAIIWAIWGYSIGYVMDTWRHWKLPMTCT